MTTVLLLFSGAVVAFIFARSLFSLLFSMQNYDLHKERLRQLNLAEKGEKTEDHATAQLIEQLTRPVVRHLLPRLKPIDNKKLELELRMNGWDQYLTPETYRALNIMLKATGVVALVALWPVEPFFAVIFFLLFFFLLGFLLRNGANNMREALFNEFPDFISIIQGYLMAGVPLTKAVEETIPYVGPEWQRLLKEFVMNCNLYSVPDAIDRLCDDVDIFEIKEFFSLIRLNLERGINIKDSFESQIEKVTEMHTESIINKINRRRIMTIVVQAPLFLCIFIVAGMPVFYSMMTFQTL